LRKRKKNAILISLFVIRFLMPKKSNPPSPPKMNMPKKPSPWLILLVIVIVFTVISSNYAPAGETTKTEEVGISVFLKNFEEGQYELVEIRGEELIGTLIGSDEKQKAIKAISDSTTDLGLNNPPENTEVKIISTEKQAFWMSLIGDILPFLIIVGIIVFLMTRMTKNAGGPFSFGQSKAKTFDRRKKKTMFADVAGAYEAKEELEEIVDFLKNPKKYTKIGAKIPRGALLIGSPGTGKTLLARAVAGEANVPFMSISGSEFVEMFVGVGASRVRDLFEKAKKAAPSIIFIDEIDAVGRQRGGGGMSGGHDEREQTLNQILTEMDGFESNTNVIVMAATNRPDVLDKALLRPGRFDRRITIDRPDIKARKEILEVHAKNKPVDPKADLEQIARITVGFSGADLENLMNEAAILVAKENRKKITQNDLSVSVEKVSLGRERKSMVMKPEARKKTAYHETGHAMMAYLLPNADPVHKLSIVSRGMALGVTWTMPEEDQYSISYNKFLDEICVLLGGYAAEEIIYGQHETGVSDDLKKATQKARSMATRYGMAPEIGPMSFADAEDHAGFESFGVKNISEEYARKIDEYVEKTVKECLKRTTDTLTKNKKLLVEIAEELLKVETLNKDDFEAFLTGKKKEKSKKMKDTSKKSPDQKKKEQKKK
jgi:cell division protease FtsH